MSDCVLKIGGPCHVENAVFTVVTCYLILLCNLRKRRKIKNNSPNLFNLITSEKMQTTVDRFFELLYIRPLLNFTCK